MNSSDEVFKAIMRINLIDKIGKALILLGLALMLYSCSQTTIVVIDNSEPTWAMCKGYEVGKKVKAMAE